MLLYCWLPQPAPTHPLLMASTYAWASPASMGPFRIWEPSRLGCALLKMRWVRRCSPSLHGSTRAGSRDQHSTDQQKVHASNSSTGRPQLQAQSTQQNRHTRALTQHTCPTNHLTNQPACPPEFWPHAGCWHRVQLSQLLLIGDRPHQGEAVAVREQRLDALPDLQQRK